LRRDLSSEVESGTLSPVPTGPPPTRKGSPSPNFTRNAGSHTAGNPNHRAEPRKSRRIPLLGHSAPSPACHVQIQSYPRPSARQPSELPQTRQTMPLTGISTAPSCDRNPPWAVEVPPRPSWRTQNVPPRSNLAPAPLRNGHGGESWGRDLDSAASNPGMGSAGRHSRRLVHRQRGNGNCVAAIDGAHQAAHCLRPSLGRSGGIRQDSSGPCCPERLTSGPERPVHPNLASTPRPWWPLTSTKWSHRKALVPRSLRLRLRAPCIQFGLVPHRQIHAVNATSWVNFSNGVM
jgi:hypothetical protein